MTELENRLLETIYGMHQMYLYHNKMVYKQLLESFELDLFTFHDKMGYEHRLHPKLLDYYARLWDFK